MFPGTSAAKFDNLSKIAYIPYSDMQMATYR